MTISDEKNRSAVSDLFTRMRIELPFEREVMDSEASLTLGSIILPYLNFLQEQTNWCWAAVAVGAAHFYDSSSTVTQCSVANGTLSRTDCCGTGASAACNIPYFLQDSLADVGHFDSAGAPIQFDAVTNIIRIARPPCIRIGWSGGGGHFLTIIGYDAGFPIINPKQRLSLADPFYGSLQVDYSGLFGSRYQGAGTWTNTFFTKNS